MAAAWERMRRSSGGRAEGRSNPIYKLPRKFFRSDAARDFVEGEGAVFQEGIVEVPGSGSAARRAAAENWRLNPEVSLGLAGEWGVAAA